MRETLSDNLKQLNDYITNSINNIEYNFFFKQKNDISTCFKSLRIVEDVCKV